MMAWLQRLIGRRKPDPPIVVPPELVSESRGPWSPYMPPPPDYYEAIRNDSRRHVGPLWRCWYCTHWCTARRCCRCHDGRRP